MTHASSVAPVCRDATSHQRVFRQPPVFFPLHHLDFVLRNTLAMFAHEVDVEYASAVMVQVADIVFRGGVSLLGRLEAPAHRLRVVMRNTVAEMI